MTNDEKIQFANKIEKALEDEGLDKQSANNVSQTLLAQTELYIGPIPSASELEKYEKILPNAADRIISITEKQAEHRRELEKLSQIEEADFNKRGQIFGLIIAVLILLVAAVAIITGQGVVGMGAILVGIASIVTSFYIPKN